MQSKIMIANDEGSPLLVGAADIVQDSPITVYETVATLPKAKIKYRLTIEPTLMLLFFGIHMAYLVEPNILEERICLHTDLGQNKSVNCFNMTTAEQKIVQPAVAELMMVKSMTDSLVPCITSLFLGPWSDINGRLPLFLTALSGVVMYNCMFCVFSTIPQLPAITFLLCSIPIAISGGFFAISIASYCYIVDITDSKTRAFRIGVLHTFFSLGKIIGSTLTPILYSKSATLVLAVSTISSIIGLVYTYFFVKETIDVKKGANTHIFNVSLLKDMKETVTKRRFGYLRSIIIISAVVLSLDMVIFRGESLTMFLYLQTQFSWTLDTYSLFSAYSILLSTTVPVISLYVFSTKLQIPDMCLASAASGLQVVSKLLTAYSSQKWQYYVAAAFGSFAAASDPLVRTQVSKIFPSEELGKTNAFISVLEGIGNTLGPIIYSTVYNTTAAHDFSNCIFLVSFIIGTFGLVLYVTVVYLLSKSTRTDDLLSN